MHVWKIDCFLDQATFLVLAFPFPSWSDSFGLGVDAVVLEGENEGEVPTLSCATSREGVPLWIMSSSPSSCSTDPKANCRDLA